MTPLTILGILVFQVGLTVLLGVLGVSFVTWLSNWADDE